LLNESNKQGTQPINDLTGYTKFVFEMMHEEDWKAYDNKAYKTEKKYKQAL